MYLKINHIGIVVDNLDTATNLYKSKLDIPFKDTVDVPSENARVSFFPIGETSIELLESTKKDSTLSKFLEKKGPGIHHICFEVDDIYKQMELLKSQGIAFTKDAPTEGAHDSLVSFIHPKSTGGVLIELMQKKSQSHG